MAIASPSAPSFCCTARAGGATQRRFSHPISCRPRKSFPGRVTARPAIVSHLEPPSDNDPEVTPDPFKRRRHRGRGNFPVYVTLPTDTLDWDSQAMRRKKAMTQSFRALALAGVEGVVLEVWWGMVERVPANYIWTGYLEVIDMAESAGLKVRAVMAFHGRGSGPRDPSWMPLPLWVRQLMDIDPGLTFSDKYGRRSREYISLGCDTLPVLHGRTPVQAYGDFMRDFKETFGSFLGDVITGIQVGLGPNGELRYPSCPSHKLSSTWLLPREIGHFQCYDKHMIASLYDNALETGIHGWGYKSLMDPTSASGMLPDPDNKDLKPDMCGVLPDPDTAEFFKSDGSWGSVYGEFFLKWYSNMLLLHGERICEEAAKIFDNNQIQMLAKIGSVHWHYGSPSHPSQLTIGYNNSAYRDGFGPFMRMFAEHDFSVCCPCFEMEDRKSKFAEPTSSPESFVKQVVRSAGLCDVPISGENFSREIDDDSFRQVIKMAKYYCDEVKDPSFSFNYIRMDKTMFQTRNWERLLRFVKVMSSDPNSDLGGGGYGGAGSSTSPFAVAAYAAYDAVAETLEREGGREKLSFAYSFSFQIPLGLVFFLTL